MSRRRVLIVSLDPVGARMAGPAIRNLEFARALSEVADVTLAVPSARDPSAHDVRVVVYDREGLRDLAATSDTLLVSGHALWAYPFLARVDAPIVVDVYDPFGIESLPRLADETEGEQGRRHGEVIDALTQLFARGDFFICASEKQRDYWLGWLEATGRINPAWHHADPTFRRLIDVVPFGIPSTPPVHTRAVLKGARPGIEAHDRVVVWGGGVYNWFDPLTLIRAVARVSMLRNDVRLFFMGWRHPTPGAQGGSMADRAIALASDLGMLGTTVFFNEWTAYADRQNYLLEADLGVSLHFDHLESHLSFRTRLLDYIWAGLPMVVTRGDVLSDRVACDGLGWTVDPEDVAQVVAALLEGLDSPRDAFRDRFAALAASLSWDRAVVPLVDYCRDPWRPPDREAVDGGSCSLAALRLVGELDAMRRASSVKDGELNELNHLLRQAEAKLANSEGTLALRQMDVANLRHAVGELRSRAQQLEQALSVRDNEIGELRQALQAGQDDLRELRRHLEAAQIAARDQRIEHLDAVRHLREAKDAEIGATRAELDRVIAESHAQHVESIRAINELKEARCAEVASLRDELSRVHSEARRQHEGHLAEMADLESRHEQSLQKLRRAKDAELEGLRHEKEMQIDRLEARIGAFTQGKIVRLLNGISRAMRGRPFV